jgi:hypothetical protein
MTRFSFPAAAAVISLALLGASPWRAGADVGATSDATFTQDVLQATGPVLVEFSEYG